MDSNAFDEKLAREQAREKAKIEIGPELDRIAKISCAATREIEIAELIENHPSARLTKSAVSKSIADRRQGRDDVDSTSSIEPWPDPVHGAELLSDLAHTIGRYVVFNRPEDALICALWALHTHGFEAFDISPRLAITSPVEQCGKTTLVKVMGELVQKPRRMDNVSPAVLFRRIDATKPTGLLDETDLWLDRDPSLIQILDSGFERGGKAERCNATTFEPEEFDVFCPMVLSGIGEMKHKALSSRCLTIELNRALRGERKKRFRKRDCSDLHELRSKMVRWWQDTKLDNPEPEIPTAIDNDRHVDLWEPLLILADAAGPQAAAEARKAMVVACSNVDPNSKVLLLQHVAQVFGGDTRLTSVEILADLNRREDWPWGDYNGKPLTKHRLSYLLRGFHINSCSVRSTRSGANTRGYKIEDIRPALERYTATPEKTATMPQPAENREKDVAFAKDVAFPETQNATRKPAEINGCDDVAFSEGGAARANPDDPGSYQDDAQFDLPASPVDGVSAPPSKPTPKTEAERVRQEVDQANALLKDANRTWSGRR